MQGSKIREVEKSINQVTGDGVDTTPISVLIIGICYSAIDSAVGKPIVLCCNYVTVFVVYVDAASVHCTISFEIVLPHARTGVLLNPAFVYSARGNQEKRHEDRQNY